MHLPRESDAYFTPLAAPKLLEGQTVTHITTQGDSYPDTRAERWPPESYRLPAILCAAFCCTDAVPTQVDTYD